MSSIIPFRFGTTAERQTGDLSGLLAVGTEAVSISALALDRAAPAIRDWTNQEMADLARVQFLLSRAGVPLETDRGLTDEGDPWFVFCDAQGEVFVHICRMGMTYLLDSPSLEAPLRGSNFEALVKGFIDRATAKVAALNVVPLDKGNKVFLHPSVMLAALIWSLFLLSDQMTNAAYASGLVPAEDEDVPTHAPRDIEGAFGLLAEALKEGGNDIDRMIANKVIGKDGLLVHPVGGLEKAGAHQQLLPSPIVVSSLSAIALAFGLLQPAESWLQPPPRRQTSMLSRMTASCSSPARRRSMSSAPTSISMTTRPSRRTRQTMPRPMTGPISSRSPAARTQWPDRLRDH